MCSKLLACQLTERLGIVTDEERRLRPSDGPGSPLESLVKPGDRPLVVPNNTLDTIEDCESSQEGI